MIHFHTDFNPRLKHHPEVPDDVGCCFPLLCQQLWIMHHFLQEGDHLCLQLIVGLKVLERETKKQKRREANLLRVFTHRVLYLPYVSRRLSPPCRRIFCPAYINQSCLSPTATPTRLMALQLIITASRSQADKC